MVDSIARFHPGSCDLGVVAPILDDLLEEVVEGAACLVGCVDFYFFMWSIFQAWNLVPVISGVVIGEDRIELVVGKGCCKVVGWVGDYCQYVECDDPLGRHYSHAFLRRGPVGRNSGFIAPDLGVVLALHQPGGISKICLSVQKGIKAVTRSAPRHRDIRPIVVFSPRHRKRQYRR